MEKRRLGKTNLQLSLLGLGGFHLVEVPFKEAVDLTNYYLDRGGNYIETAQLYGYGDSEKKVGEVMKTRRKECILATKSPHRAKDKLLESIDKSLKNLNTDWIDIFFLHGLDQDEALKKVTAPEGALEGIEKAKKEGKIRFVAFSNHVTPSVALKTIQVYPFDAVMIPLNYFDYFNFPQWEDKLLPRAKQRDIGVLAMKPFADGFLWRSWEKALRYTLT
ncbi:aldo/keto reductase, partial [Patescibacteria group bacterium]|nr:aldo/keto reductase [Patescibacteria group bacterium]